MGGSPEGQRNSGRLNILQEANLKGTGASHPHVSKEKSAWKKTIVAEQSCNWNSGEKKNQTNTTKPNKQTIPPIPPKNKKHIHTQKREILLALEEWAVSSGGLQGCCEFLQGENFKAKAKIELYLATAVKDTENDAINTLAKKNEGLRSICFLHWILRKICWQRMRKRLKYLMPSLT